MHSVLSLPIGTRRYFRSGICPDLIGWLLAANTTMCKFCDEKTHHPLFCYLIGDQQSNASTYIGLSRQPFFRLKSHNREPGYRCGAKSTKASAGQWRILLVIGPWYGNGGRAFKQAWRRSSRKLKSRLAMGLLKAQEENKNAYWGGSMHPLSSRSGIGGRSELRQMRLPFLTSRHS